MRLVTACAAALGLLAAGATFETPAVAAAPIAGYTGSAKSSVAGCPYIMWRLARHDNGDVTGIFYYSDMSGVSQVKGTVDKAGHFQLTLASSMGQGPVGTVTGTKRGENVTAVMTGEGCANAKFSVKPVESLNDYH